MDGEAGALELWVGAVVSAGFPSCPSCRRSAPIPTMAAAPVAKASFRVKDDRMMV